MEEIQCLFLRREDGRGRKGGIEGRKGGRERIGEGRRGSESGREGGKRRGIYIIFNVGYQLSNISAWSIFPHAVVSLVALCVVPVSCEAS